MFPFLGWLEPYFVERDSSTNFEPQQQEEEDAVDDENDNDNDEMNDSASVVSSVAPSDISNVTGRAQYRKRARYYKYKVSIRQNNLLLNINSCK